MPFGQVVIGPPGSGKSTFCHGMQQFMQGIERKPVLVNLDPANEFIPYACDLDIREIICTEEIMREKNLGPNGALVYAMEETCRNVDWLVERLEEFPEDSYFIFDLPGQIELSTCHDGLAQIVRHLERRNFRLCIVHLCDSTHLLDPMKYISMLIVSLETMMQLACPQVNVLSKIDLAEAHGALPFRLEYYTDVQDLRYLLTLVEGTDGIAQKYSGLSRALCDLIEESNLISFAPLAIEDKDCMTFVLGEIDKANGYIFGGLTPANDSVMEAAMSDARREAIIELVKEHYLIPVDYDQADSTLETMKDS